MKRTKSLLVVLTVLLVGSAAIAQQNPLLEEWDTPFGVPPFDRIQVEHFMPAYQEAMREHVAEVDAIVSNPEAPTFGNTIEALERSGARLSRVSAVFRGLNSANTSDELQAVAKEISPLISKHFDDIAMNEKLFERVKAVYGDRGELDLTPEQSMLLEKTYKGFVRNGALLGEAEKDELREINKEHDLLSLQFAENVLKETNSFELVIESEDDLAGLPEAVVSGAAETAAERGHEGKWVFTTQKPSMLPFLQYSQKRDLREKIFKAYINRGNNGDEFDNNEIVSKIVDLRIRRANILGYETHAHYVLEERMAKEPEAVYDLLWKIWKPGLERAKNEANELQAMIYEEGGDIELMPWDWWYYAEKVKKAKYDLDEEMLRPYFELENVLEGVFELANRLWGITFEERSGVPVYHEDVTVYEVKEEDGTHLGLLYTDYFPRASKRGGAWCGGYRDQSIVDGKNIRPIMTNCGNFSKPTGDIPALLSYDEVTTMFHEFGHGLHGLLSNTSYERLSGSGVAWDFVELPSQIMENWCTEPEMMKIYALHYETGEPIPDELIAKIKKAKHFNQGFATTEFIAAAFLDMDWHTLARPTELAPTAFDDESMGRIGLIPEIIVRYRSPYYRHIFAGGYSAGYYSYIWAEVLDADAFQAFKEAGLFDRETGNRFRENILAKGGTEEPMTLYVRFRGSEPSIEPLLERRGLK
jgi:peptidyl-dipeptidase Dcp